MHRREFELIADVLASVRDDMLDFRSPEEVADELEIRMTESLKSTNDRFDPIRFRLACKGRKVRAW